uniref:Proline-rich protein n=1 Tax=Nephotettix cincticeps TaxID=94400 RepID=A0A7M3T1X4_NEPCI|nr:proline-rich protein [Nephotettix cincticeps]
MRYHKDFDSSNFERHEIKTYQRKGDQVRSEYERLNPDGTVTKTVAYGDCKEGLKYRTYHMGLDGVVREIPQEVVQRMMQMQNQQVPPVAPPRPQVPPAASPAPQEKPAKKAFAFMVEPKETHDGQSVWRVRPLTIKTKEAPAQPTPPPPPPPPTQPQPTNRGLPWWYDTLKEAINESMKEDKPQIPKPEPPPPEPEPKKLSKRLFDWLDDDFFALKPIKSAPKPKLFDNLLGDFDKPLLNIFNTPMLEDF